MNTLKLMLQNKKLTKYFKIWNQNEHPTVSDILSLLSLIGFQFHNRTNIVFVCPCFYVYQILHWN